MDDMNVLSYKVREISYAIHDEDGTIIGEYFADIIVNDCLLVELKSCKVLVNEHKAQVLHFLKATGIGHGLLINFGSYEFEIQKFIHTRPVSE